MKHAFENHKQWPAVKAACEKLTDHGFKTYLAGGCVRDFLMDRVPNDFDIASQATPDQVEALFPNSLMVGRAFGVSIIPHDGFQLEIATFRKDGEYRDGRHPEGVIFADEVEDAKRRDFTVNALFYDLEREKIIDHVGGLNDLRIKTLRAVGEPAKRFEEDKLRLLRAVRFAAQLDFEIEPITWSEVRRLAPEIHVVSRERVRDELLKLLDVSSRTKGLALLRESSMIEVLFPALGDAFRETEFAESFEDIFQMLDQGFDGKGPALEATALLAMLRERPSLWLSLFFLNHVVGQGKMALSSAQQLELLNSLKIDNQTREDIVWTWKQLASLQRPDELSPYDRLKLLMSPLWGFTYSLACILNSHIASRDQVLDRDQNWREAIELFEKQGGVLGQKPVPWIMGKDLQANGILPGVEMGRLLEQALRHQLLGDWENREAGLTWVRGLPAKPKGS